jgi:ribosomal protein S12 methylthiotransferase
VPASGPRILRQRLEGGPMAPLKIASGCDRRCAFCAIPRWRGAFVSRPFDDIVAEAQMLAADGVRELLLVSENSTSYGKDIGDIRMLDKLLVALTRVDGIERVRVSYLQPAELRPDLVELIVRAPKVAPYLDLSFQHASPTLLRRMRRFGDSESFLQLLRDGRRHSPDLGARTNVIVGFPGEDERDLLILENFLIAARFDAIGVFGYSDEEDTEGAELDGKIPDEQIAERVERISRLVDYVTAQRAEDRIGQDVQVLVESLEDGPEGRAAHQGPDDGVTRLELPRGREVAVGDLVDAVVVASDGIDLVARPRTHLPLTS